MERRPVPPRSVSVGQVGAGMGVRRAERYMGKPDETRQLLDTATHKAERKGRRALAQVWDGFTTLIRINRAYVSRRYTRVPWKTMLYALGAVVYFVSLIDLIPDVIVGIGFVDDVAVIAWVLKAFQSDLAEFRQWELETGGLKDA